MYLLGDLDRIIERGEEFETKGRELEGQIRELESKVRETEAVTVKNADEEDAFENARVLRRAEEETKQNGKQGDADKQMP